MKRWLTASLAMVVSVFIAGKIASWYKASVTAPHRDLGRNARFVIVEPNIELEVVDFGGVGRPLILLAGWKGTAHSFDGFPSHLTTRYHVFGITRRGFGLSSATTSGYTAERLGEDVVAVIEALNVVRPVLVGSSFAGEELSSVATFHPDKISGLIYLDAANGYALYDQIHGNLAIRVATIARIIEPLIPSAFEPKLFAATAGQRKFTELHVPVLAIFPDPHDLSSQYKDADQRAKAEARDSDRTERQISAIQRQVPSAKIVRLPHAAHLVWQSNEADVLSAMTVFIGSLP